MQYTYALEPRWEFGAVKLRAALDFQSPLVRQAATAVAKQLDQLGVRYAFAGGLAVGAHGHLRVTSDVDLLVGPEAFEHHQGGLVTFKPGVPINVNGVRIDYLTGESLGMEIDQLLESAVLSDGLRVVPIEVLVHMKLAARRLQDQADIAELIKSGIDVERVRTALSVTAADLLPLFERIFQQANRE